MEIDKKKADEYFRDIADAKDANSAWKLTNRGSSAIRPYVVRKCGNRIQLGPVKSIRVGKGFSLNELKEAKVNLFLFKRNSIPIDYKRKSVHSSNVESILEISEIVRGLQGLKHAPRNRKLIRPKRNRRPFV